MRIFGEGFTKRFLAALLSLFLFSCSSDQVDQDEDLDTESAQQEEDDQMAGQEDVDPAEELAEETDEGALDAMSSLSELTEAIQETEQAAPEPLEASPMPAAPPATPGVVYVGYNVGNVLFVKNSAGTIHSSPEAGAAPAGTLSDKERVTVQGRKGTWVQVGENQWVAFADLSADIRMAKKGTHFVTAYRLNIRNKPNGKVLGQLAKGETVSVQGSSGNWIKIGNEKYVHKKYLSNKIAH